MASLVLGIVQIFRRKGSSYLTTCRNLGFVLKELVISVPEPQDWFFPRCRNKHSCITDTLLSSKSVTVADRGWPSINRIPPNQSFEAGIIIFLFYDSY